MNLSVAYTPYRRDAFVYLPEMSLAPVGHRLGFYQPGARNMKHIPFVAFPQAEQEAVLAALREAGMQPQGFCVSRVEWVGAADAGEGPGFALVTAPGLCRSYPADAGAGWVGAMRQDLCARFTPACAPA